jgi:hypothetical protein
MEGAMMLGQTFDPEHPFFKEHHMEVSDQRASSITLLPQGFYARDLLQINLDLQEQRVTRARMKINRALLTHELLGESVVSAGKAFIESIFPKDCQTELKTWLGNREPAWLTNSDKIELDQYSLTSRLSQSWLQLDGSVKSTKEGSWWSRITGR